MKIEIHVDIPHLGDRIKEARLEDSRTLLAICKEIEMTPSNWYKIEQEVNKVLPIQTFLQICAVLGTDFDVDLKEEVWNSLKESLFY